MKTTRRSSRGFGLIDALIAMAILSFGLLALTRFQTRLVSQASEAQERLTAVQRGDELLSMVVVDGGNAPCYTLPAAGVCGSAVASARAASWAAAMATALPGTVTTGSVLAGNLLTLTINWTGKESGDPRTLTATTDVRQ